MGPRLDYRIRVGTWRKWSSRSSLKRERVGFGKHWAGQENSMGGGGHGPETRQVKYVSCLRAEITKIKILVKNKILYSTILNYTQLYSTIIKYTLQIL